MAARNRSTAGKALGGHWEIREPTDFLDISPRPRQKRKTEALSSGSVLPEWVHTAMGVTRPSTEIQERIRKFLFLLSFISCYYFSVFVCSRLYIITLHLYNLEIN